MNTQKIAMNSCHIFSTVLIELSIAPQVAKEWGDVAPPSSQNKSALLEGGETQ
jgi:hypothetical protein